MRRFTMLIICLLAIASFMATTAWAQNPHFISGPTHDISGSTLTECATIAGLGSTVTDITLSCTATFQCVNKQGKIDDAHVTLTNDTLFTPHNGVIKNACVSVTATCPPGQQGPNNLNFGSCSYTVSQNGTIVLTE